MSRVQARPARASAGPLAEGKEPWIEAAPMPGLGAQRPAEPAATAVRRLFPHSWAPGELHFGAQILLKSPPNSRQPAGPVDAVAQIAPLARPLAANRDLPADIYRVVGKCCPVFTRFVPPKASIRACLAITVASATTSQVAWGAKT